MRKLRLVLGDQLNLSHSWYSIKEEETLYVLMEIEQETSYAHHHIQKIMAFFAAMRNFNQELKDQGHRTIYLTLDEPKNKQSLSANLQMLINEFDIEKFEYQLPDEYRLDCELREFSKKLIIPAESLDTEHFLTSRDEVSKFFTGKKQFLMESFYRHMRKKYDILMNGDQPESGKWNFDQSNRKKYKGKEKISPGPDHLKDLKSIYQLLKRKDIDTIGEVDPENFNWPVTRKDATTHLDYFVRNLLPYFGSFQDAMHTDHWKLFHSRLSFLLNVKILHPLEVIEKVTQAYIEDHASIEQVEGFVRQIIGWREFMRGIYWCQMPEYESLNFFNHSRNLPQFYWTGKTRMNCLHHAISQSLKYAYAHHIQRLMVTGNFALLAGIDPDQVDEWYLGIYIDAIQWVEITNTRGMSQFADGGIIGTKPYVSSSNYISKMSNYCDQCFYSNSKKVGEKACPFNSLYWHFYHRNRDKLGNNQRISMMYRTLDKMDRNKREDLLRQATHYLDNLEDL